MSGPPTQSVEVFPKKAATWSTATSTGSTDEQLLVAANPNRKWVEVWNVSANPGRVQEAESVSHAGVYMYGATQAQTAGAGMATYHHKFEGTEAIWVRSNGANTTIWIAREV